VREDIWQVVRDEHDIVRINVSLKAPERRRGLHVRVSVQVDLADADRREVERLEARVDELVADRAVLAAARTTADERVELTYYAASAGWVDELIDEIERDDAARSVAVSGERDPRWDAVTRYF
jgi:hypothetical protein